jgi:hypothetical protein
MLTDISIALIQGAVWSMLMFDETECGRMSESVHGRFGSQTTFRPEAVVAKKTTPE